MTTPASRPIPATIAAVVRDGHVLLVRRANPPDQGRWAFPGGKIDRRNERVQSAGSAISSSCRCPVVIWFPHADWK